MRFNMIDFEEIKTTLPADKERDVQLIIDQMKVENISVDGWELEEEPIASFYCFFNKKERKAFDISIEKERVQAVYRTSQDENAESIQEAIDNYEF